MRETRHLWIGNLADNIREERIAEHFKRYGKIDKVRFLPRRSGETGLSACVAFMDIRSAQKAKSGVNVLGDRELITDYFDPAARSSSGAADEAPKHGQQQQQQHRTNQTRRYEAHRESAVVGEEKPGYGDRYSRDRQASYDRSYQTSNIQAGGTENYDSDSRGRIEGNIKVKSRSKGSNSSAKASHDPSSKKHKADSAKSAKKKSKKMKDEDGRQKQTGPKKIKQKHAKERGRSPTVKRKKSANASTSPGGGKKSGKLGAGSSSAGRSSSSGSVSMSTSGSGRTSSTSSTSSSVSGNSSRTRTTTNSGSESSYETEGPPTHQKLVAMCIKKLPVRPTVTSLRDGVFHEFKKYGKVKSVLIRGEGVDRHALVLFRTAAEANKAVSHAKTKLLFGAAIEASIYEGEVSGQELEEGGGIIDEFHPRASRTLFVGNLDKTVGYSDIQNIFIRFGEIVAIEIKKQHNIPQYAFLQYTDILSVIRAITKMDGEKLGRNTLKLGFGKTVMSSCLWVDGVTDSFTENYLASCFQRYGPVKHVVIDRNRGQALVFYSQFDFAQSAMAKMRARILNGSRLKMDYASNELIDIFLKHMQTSGQSIKGLENIRQLMQPASSPPSSSMQGPGSSYSRASVSQDTRQQYYDDRSQSSFGDDPYGSTDPNYRRGWRGRSRDRYQYPPDQSSRHGKRSYEDSYERQDFYRERSPPTWEHDGYNERRTTVSSHYDQDYRQKDYDIRREPRTYNRKSARGNVPYDEMFQGGYRTSRDRGREGDREREIEHVRDRDRVGEQYYNRAAHSSPVHPRYVSHRSRSISPQPNVGQRDADTYSTERTVTYRRRGRSGSRSPDLSVDSLRRRNSMESKSSSHSGSRYTSRTGDIDMRENMSILMEGEDKLSINSPIGEVEFNEKQKKLRVRKRVIEESPVRDLSDSSPKPHRRLGYKNSASENEKASSSYRNKEDRRIVEETQWASESPTYSDNRSRSGTPTRDENQDLIGEVIIKQPSSSKSSHRIVEKASRTKEDSKQRSGERKDKNKPHDKDYRKGFTASDEIRKLDSAVKGKTGRSNSASLIQRVHSPSELERKTSAIYTKDFDYRKHSVVRSSKSSGDVVSKLSLKIPSKHDEASEKIKRSKLQSHVRSPRASSEYGDEAKNSPLSNSPASDQPRRRLSGSSKLLKREYSPRPDDMHEPYSEKYSKTDNEKTRIVNEKQKHLKDRVSSSRSKERDEENIDVDERRSYSQKRRHSAGDSDSEEMHTKRDRKSSTGDHARHKMLSQKHEAPMSIARQMFLQEEDVESGAESPLHVKDGKSNVIDEKVERRDESETAEQDQKDENPSEDSPTSDFSSAKLAVAQSLLPKRLPKSVPTKETEKTSPAVEEKVEKKQSQDGNLTDLEKEKERLQQLLSKLDSEKHLDVKAAAEVADVVLQELTQKAKSKILATKTLKDVSIIKDSVTEKSEKISTEPSSSNDHAQEIRQEENETYEDVTFEEEVVVDTIEEVMEDEVIESEIEEVSVIHEEVEDQVENPPENIVSQPVTIDVQVPVPVVPVITAPKSENIDNSQGYRKQMEAKKKESEHLEKKREHNRKKLMRKQEKEKKKHIKKVSAMRGPSQTVISSVDDGEDDTASPEETEDLSNQDETSQESANITKQDEKDTEGSSSQDQASSQGVESSNVDCSGENCEPLDAKKSKVTEPSGEDKKDTQNLDLQKPWPPDKPGDEKVTSASLEQANNPNSDINENKEITSNPVDANLQTAVVEDAKNTENSEPVPGKTISPLTPGSVGPSPMVTTPQPVSKDPSPQSAGHGITPGSLASSSLSQKSSRNTPATTPSTTRTPNFTTPSPASTSSTSSSKSQNKQHQTKNAAPISSHRQSGQVPLHSSKKQSHHSRSDPHARNRGSHSSASDYKRKGGHHHHQHRTSSSSHSSKFTSESSKMKNIIPISRRPMASITVGLDASPSKPLGKSELERLKIELESVKNQLNLEMSPSSLSPCSEDEAAVGKSPAQLLSPVSPVLRSPADMPVSRKVDTTPLANTQSGVSPSSTPTLTDRLKLIGRVKKRTPGSTPSVKNEVTPVQNSNQKPDEIRQSRIFRSNIFDQDSERLSHVRRQLEEEKNADQKAIPFSSGVPLFAGSKFLEQSPAVNILSSSGSLNIASSSLPKETNDNSAVSMLSTSNSLPAPVDVDVASRQLPLSSLSGPKNVYSLSSSELPATAERIAHDFAGKNCNIIVENNEDKKHTESDVSQVEVQHLPAFSNDFENSNLGVRDPSPSMLKSEDQTVSDSTSITEAGDFAEETIILDIPKPKLELKENENIALNEKSSSISHTNSEVLDVEPVKVEMTEIDQNPKTLAAISSTAPQKTENVETAEKDPKFGEKSDSSVIENENQQQNIATEADVVKDEIPDALSGIVTEDGNDDHYLGEIVGDMDVYAGSCMEIEETCAELEIEENDDDIVMDVTEAGGGEEFESEAKIIEDQKNDADLKEPVKSKTEKSELTEDILLPEAKIIDKPTSTVVEKDETTKEIKSDENIDKEKTEDLSDEKVKTETKVKSESKQQKETISKEKVEQSKSVEKGTSAFKEKVKAKVKHADKTVKIPHDKREQVKDVTKSDKIVKHKMSSESAVSKNTGELKKENPIVGKKDQVGNKKPKHDIIKHKTSKSADTKPKSDVVSAEKAKSDKSKSKSHFRKEKDSKIITKTSTSSIEGDKAKVLPPKNQGERSSPKKQQQTDIKCLSTSSNNPKDVTKKNTNLQDVAAVSKSKEKERTSSKERKTVKDIKKEKKSSSSSDKLLSSKSESKKSKKVNIKVETNDRNPSVGQSSDKSENVKPKIIGDNIEEMKQEPKTAKDKTVTVSRTDCEKQTTKPIPHDSKKQQDKIQNENPSSEPRITSIKEPVENISSKKKKKKKKQSDKDVTANEKGKLTRKISEDRSKSKPESSNYEKSDKRDPNIAEKVKMLSKSISNKSKLSSESKSLSVEVLSEKSGLHGDRIKSKSHKKEGTSDKVSSSDISKKKSIKPHDDLKVSHSLPDKSLKDVSGTKKSSSKQVSNLKTTGKASSASPASISQSRYSMIYDSSSSDSEMSPANPPSKKKKVRNESEVEESKNLQKSEAVRDDKNKSNEKSGPKRMNWSTSSMSSCSSIDAGAPPPILPCSSLVTETIKNETILPPGYDDDDVDDRYSDKDDKMAEELNVKTEEKSDSAREMSPILGGKIKKKTTQLKKDSNTKTPDNAIRRLIVTSSDSDSSDQELVISMSSTDDSDDEIGSMSAWAKVDADAAKAETEEKKTPQTGKSEYGLDLSSDSDSTGEEFPVVAKTSEKKKIESNKVSKKLSKKPEILKKKTSKSGMSKSKTKKDLFSDNSDTDSEAEKRDSNKKTLTKPPKDSKKGKDVGLTPSGSKLSESAKNVKAKPLVTKTEKVKYKSDIEFSSSSDSDDFDAVFTSKQSEKKKDVVEIPPKLKDSSGSKSSKAIIDKTKSDSKLAKRSFKSDDKKEKLKVKSASVEKLPSTDKLKDNSSKSHGDKTLQKIQHHGTSRSPAKEKTKTVKESTSVVDSSKHETKVSSSSKKEHSHKSKHSGGKNVPTTKSHTSDGSSKTPHKSTGEGVLQKHSKKSSKTDDKKILDTKPLESEVFVKDPKLHQKPKIESKNNDASENPDVHKHHKKKKMKKAHKLEEKSNAESQHKEKKTTELSGKESADKEQRIEKDKLTIPSAPQSQMITSKLSEMEQKALARSLFNSDSDDDDDENIIDDNTENFPLSTSKQHGKDTISTGRKSPKKKVKEEIALGDTSHTKEKGHKHESNYQKSKTSLTKMPSLHPLHSHRLSSPKSSEKRRGSAESFLTTSTTDESDLEQRMAVQSAISSLDHDDDMAISPDLVDIKQESGNHEEEDDNLPPPFVSKPMFEKDQKSEMGFDVMSSTEKNLPSSPSKSSHVKSESAKPIHSTEKKKKSKKDKSHRERRGHKSLKPHVPGFSLSKHGLPFSGKDRREHIDKLKSSSHERDEEAVRSIMGILDESSDADSYFSDVRPEDSSSHASVLGNQTPDSDRGRRRSLDSDASTGRSKSSTAPVVASDASFETLHEVESKPEVVQTTENVKVEDSTDVIDTRTTAEENELAAAVSSIEALFGDFDNKPSTFEDFSSAGSSAGYNEQQVAQDQVLEPESKSNSKEEKDLSQEDLDRGSDEAAMAASTLLMETNEEDNTPYFGYRDFQNQKPLSESSSNRKTSTESRYSDDAFVRRSSKEMDIELPSIRTDIGVIPATVSDQIADQLPSSGQSKPSRKRQRQTKSATSSVRSSSLESKSDLTMSDASASESELLLHETGNSDIVRHGKGAKQRKIGGSPSHIQSGNSNKSDSYDFDASLKTHSLSLPKPETTIGTLPFVPSSNTTTFSHLVPSTTTSSIPVSSIPPAPFVTVSSTPPTAGIRSSSTEKSPLDIKPPSVLPTHQPRRTSYDIESSNIAVGQAKRRASTSSSTAPSPTHGGSQFTQLTSSASSFGGMHMPGSSVYLYNNSAFLPQNPTVIGDPTITQPSPTITQSNMNPATLSPHQTSPRFFHPTGQVFPQAHLTSPRAGHPSTTMHSMIPSSVQLSQPQVYYPHISQGHSAYMTTTMRPMVSYANLRHTSPTSAQGIQAPLQFVPRHTHPPPQPNASSHTNLTSMPSHFPNTSIVGSIGQQPVSTNNTHSSTSYSPALSLYSATAAASLTTPSSRQHQAPQAVQQRIPETSQTAQHHVGVPTYPHAHHIRPHQPPVSTQASIPQNIVTATRTDTTPKSLPRPQLIPQGMFPHGYPLPTQISPKGFPQQPFPILSPTRHSAAQISPSSAIPPTTPQTQDKSRAGIQRQPSDPYLIKPNVPPQSTQTVSLASPHIKITETTGQVQVTEKTEAPRPQPPSPAVPNTSQPVMSQMPPQMFAHHPHMYYPQGLHTLPGGFPGLPYMAQPFILRPGIPPPTSVMHPAAAQLPDIRHSQQKMMSQQQRLQLDKPQMQVTTAQQQPLSHSQTPLRKEQKIPQTEATKSSPTMRDPPHSLRPPFAIHQAGPPPQLHPSTQATSHPSYGPPFTASPVHRSERGERIVRMPSEISQIDMVDQHFRQSGIPTTPPRASVPSTNYQPQTDKPRQLVPPKQEHANVPQSLPHHVLYPQSVFQRPGLGMPHPHGFRLPAGIRYPTSQADTMWLRPGANFRPPTVPPNLAQQQHSLYVSAAEANRPTPHLTPARSPHPRLPSSQAPQSTPPPSTTPKPASSAPPNDQVMDLFQRYPVIWQGLLALRNDSAAVQTHFICGDLGLAQACLPKPDASQTETDRERNLAVLRIVQRMRLEPPQLEGVDKRMTANSDFCLLLALPCGRDKTDVIRQQNALKQGFIDYLKQKQAAGIVNVKHAQPQNQVQYVLHVFPPCDFTTKHLQDHARDLLSNINDIQHIMIVIAAV